MKRVVFFGNCQSLAVFRCYKAVMRDTYGHEVTAVQSWRRLTDADRETVARADLVVEQFFTGPQLSALSECPSGAPVVQFPTLCLGFLWPYATMTGPHPKNAKIAYRMQGPYSAEDSDTYLNRLIRGGEAPDAALDRYLAEDVGKQALRRYELFMDQQRDRDAATGFDFAAAMERRFRDEHLFGTPYHPRLPFARLFVAEVLKRLGVPYGLICRAIDELHEAPFPRGELPIHPSVAAALGLRWIHDAYPYQTFTGERQSFHDYFASYLDYRWNAPLADALALADAHPLSDAGADAAIVALEAALAGCTGSAEAYRVLGDLLLRRRDNTGAARAFGRAMALEPALALPLIGLAEAYYRLGRYAEARPLLERAAALQPNHAETRFRLGRALEPLGQFEAAAAAARRALELNPSNIWYALFFAKMTALAGEWEAGEASLRALADRHAQVIGPQLGLGNLYEKQQRWEESAQAYGAAHATRPHEFEPLRFYARALLHTDARAAETATRRALAMRPHDAETLNCLSRALFGQGRPEEARDAVERAVALDPGHEPFRVWRETLLQAMEGALVEG